MTKMLLDEARKYGSAAIDLRRRLHRNPELVLHPGDLVIWDIHNRLALSSYRIFGS